MLTSDELSARTDRAVTAAAAAGRREWALLHAVTSSRAAFESAFPGVGVQPIHGDAPTNNVLVTADGEIWSDFEHVTVGPVEWDLTFAFPEGVDAYDAAAGRLGLRPLDRRLLRVMEAARLLQVVACLCMAPQLPMLAEGLRPSVEQWRNTPLAGGLAETGTR